MKNKLPNTHDFCFMRAPADCRSSLFTMVVVRIGIMTALGQFMLGALLGHTMSFYDALLATFLGSMLLECVSLGLGIAGAREGFSTSQLARWCGFGFYGSSLVSILIAFSLIGWFGVQNAILANGLNYAMNNKPGFVICALLSGLGLTALITFGFRAMGWIAILTVPLFMLVVGCIVRELLAGHHVIDLMSTLPKGEPMTLGMAATAVGGGYIVAAISTADIGRSCQNGRHVFWMITLSIIAGEFVVNSIAILIAHALNTSDVLTILTQTAGWIGLLSVILSALKINDSNLYSSSLALLSAVEVISGRRLSYVGLTLALGTVGTLLTVAGILEKFTDFLLLLGVMFPPVAGVMLCDYWLLKTHRVKLDESLRQQQLPDSKILPAVGWNGVIACLAGILTGLMIQMGIPSLNSLLVSIMVYALLNSYPFKKADKRLG
ncbi:cytosine permease [Candidatus Williamhamiltonella defendens]|uniref:cytosine permease n=1 Tax=Candidatus Williamhamiltonella defendens TaxID=138072 RepID=UPI001F45CAD4|nr:cytosine permease [Candidatus Hamiltonella defensa]